MRFVKVNVRLPAASRHRNPGFHGDKSRSVHMCCRTSRKKCFYVTSKGD